jgi:ribosomal protein L11 methyltransferase
LIRLAVRVRRERSELVLAELLGLAPSGVEEVSISEELIEFAVYGPPGELPTLPDLEAAAGDALVEISTEEIADDWADRWREFHRPVVLDGKLTVRPPWEPPGSTPVDVIIDPGRAFGTGAHPTTGMCLELMLTLVPDGGFPDLGSGSGVLAVTAAKLGFEPVVAVDNDRASVAAARENAAYNGAVVEVRRADLRRDPLPQLPTVAANLLAPLLLEWAGRLVRSSWRPRAVIASGLLLPEADRVAAGFAASGLTESERLTEGEWQSLLLQR